MEAKDTVPMQCTYCHRNAEYSPLRLGRVCGRCKQGRWIPRNKVEVTNERPDGERDR